MDILKFKKETKSLKNFFEIYCCDKHNNIFKIEKLLSYRDAEFEIELNLCEECHKKIDYCINRLFECSHEKKPKCRSCPNPCYEKKQWKETAKIMRYSGIKLGLSSIKKIFLKEEKNSPFI